MANYYYVKNGFGTCVTTATSTTKRTGAFSAMTASDTYAHIRDVNTYNTLVDGDIICCSDAHSHSQAGDYFVDYSSNLLFIISVSDLNADQYSYGAQEYASGYMRIASGSTTSALQYIKGMIFGCGNSFTPIQKNGNKTIMEDCYIDMPTGGATSTTDYAIYILYSGELELLNTNIRPTDVSNGSIMYFRSSPKIVWKGGSVIANTNKTDNLAKLYNGANGLNLFLDTVDLSNMNSNFQFIIGGTPYQNGMVEVNVSNCITPSVWSPIDASHTYGIRTYVYNTDTSSNYNEAQVDGFGSALTETTNTRTGGAVIESQAISNAVSTTSIAKKGAFPFRYKIFSGRDDFTTSKTVKINVMHDSQGSGTSGALQDDEAWIEVHVPNSSGPGKKIYSCQIGSIFGTPSDHPTNSETWDTTGITTPVYQELSITTTGTDGSGEYQIFLCVAAPSIDMFACPNASVA